MENKTNYPNYTEKQTAKCLGCSDSTIERYRTDTNMNCPYGRKRNQKETSQSSLFSSTNLSGGMPTQNENSETNLKTNLYQNF